MNVSNDDIRHGVSFLSIFWSAVTIFSISTSQIDYTIIMFLITNFVTVIGFPLKKECDKRIWHVWSKVLKYGTVILGIFLFLDSYSSAIMFKILPHPKVCSALIILLIGVMYLIFQSKCVSVDSLINISENISKSIVEQFKEATDETKNWIEENGGLKNVIKNNPEAAALLKSAAKTAKTFTPQDHHRRYGRHSKGKR